MVLLRLLDRSLGLVSTAILARLLMPADFGVVAMAMSIIGLIELATAFSFEVALIQNPDPKRVHYDTAWTLNVLLAIAGAVATVLLAQPAAAFYSEPRLVPVMYAIGAAWMISGFENIGTVNFRRNMDFKREFRLLAYKRSISFVVTIATAIALRSYWALVIGMLVGRLTGVGLSYLMEPFRPRPSLAAWRQLIQFSGWMLLGNFAGSILGRLPQFFVGRMFGPTILGAYTVGSEIAQLAQTELVGPINRALIPGYSRLSENLESFRRVCIDSTAGVLLLVLPASAGIAVLAEPIVRVLLGAQWNAAVPVIQVLAFSGAVSAIASNNSAAFVASGRPYLMAALPLTRLAVLVPAVFVFASNWGMPGILYAELLAAVAGLLVSYPLLFRLLKIRFKGYVSALWRPIVASAVMSATVHTTLAPTGPALGFGAAIADLTLGIPVGVGVYAGMVWALWLLSSRPDGVEASLLKYIGATWRSINAR